MADTYRVFRRKPWTPSGRGYVPNPGARKTILRKGLTIEQAREWCKDGPANIARDAGKEYRHLYFYEFERD